MLHSYGAAQFDTFGNLRAHVSFSSLGPFPPHPVFACFCHSTRRLWNSSWLPRFFHSKRGNLAPLPRRSPEKLIGKECVVVNELHQANAQEILFQRPSFLLVLPGKRTLGEKSPTTRGVGESSRKNCSTALIFSFFPAARHDFKPRKPARVPLLILNSVKRNLFLSFLVLLAPPHTHPPAACCAFSLCFSRRSPCCFFSLSFFCQTPRRPLLNFHSKSQFKFLFTSPSRRTVMAESTAAPKKGAFYTRNGFLDKKISLSLRCQPVSL